MENPKINTEMPQEEVLLPESRKSISDAHNLVGQFFKLERPHEPPKESIARVVSSYDLRKSDYVDIAKEVSEELAALVIKEANILSEAKEKAEKYQQMLKDL